MMRHLGHEQLVDLLDGAADSVSDSVPHDAASMHLQTCGRCQASLEALRDALHDLSSNQVPEPSPLFWDHFSARVHRAIEAQPMPAASGAAPLLAAGWLRRVWKPAVAISCLAAALFVAAVTVFPRRQAGGERAGLSSGSMVNARVDTVASSGEDDSLALVADLVEDFDWEAAREAGLTTHVGADDDAVSLLSSDERGELGRLLQGELRPSRRGA